MTRYIRYRSGSGGSGASLGILEGDTVREIHGDLFGSHSPTGVTHRLSEVTLLAPCQPGKIMGVGLNYRSHLGDAAAARAPRDVL